MPFFSLFKTLINFEVTVELKDGMIFRGILASIDSYFNVTLKGITIVNAAGNEAVLYALNSIFLRGNSLRYIHLPADAVDTVALQDATRVEQCDDVNA
ncbi:LSM2-like protein [Morchella conica CCBAS932]|uniref:LSM2-like protein n=1 Tax=Morchella conica CCBAS932 TaxID=1392247 RepID=A0A3N4KKL2_9PEZI|nr:LSM2-like protein [Morchella conica CCBAS932]